MMTAWIAFLFALAPFTASAAQPEILRFFESLEGLWSGQGIYERREGGHESRRDYSFEVEVEYAGSRTWRVENSVSDINGQHRFVGFFHVRGDALYVSSDSPAQPVAVIESTPRKLTYRYGRIEGPTGRVLEYTYSLYLQEDSSLSGENTVSGGGERLVLDRFHARRPVEDSPVR